jgi:hypothetical protein
MPYQLPIATESDIGFHVFTEKQERDLQETDYQVLD